MMNISHQQDGIEFEKICKNILIDHGFQVEMTQTTNDGGIDLIATRSDVFIKGKYIIQCKCYTGSVGVPYVRDLYGVVTNERANKGILMTTGTFTEQAIKFASNKNLELIDGPHIQQLLNSTITSLPTSLVSTYSFTAHPLFDNKRFQFYKQLIDCDNLTIELTFDLLFTFLFQYFSENSDHFYEIIHHGLSKEYIRLFDVCMHPYYTGLKFDPLTHYHTQIFKNIAQLFDFQLFDFVYQRFKLFSTKSPLKLRIMFNDYGYTDYPLNQVPENHLQKIIGMDIENIQYHYSYSIEYYELLNLLSLFQFFNIKQGIERVLSTIYGMAPELKPWFKKDHLFRMINDHSKLLILYPKLTLGERKTGKRIRKAETHILYSPYEQTIDLTTYYNQYQDLHKDHITQELEKIQTLLD